MFKVSEVVFLACRKLQYFFQQNVRNSVEKWTIGTKLLNILNFLAFLVKSIVSYVMSFEWAYRNKLCVFCNLCQLNLNPSPASPFEVIVSFYEFDLVIEKRIILQFEASFY